MRLCLREASEMHDAQTRMEVVGGLAGLGVNLDAALNVNLAAAQNQAAAGGIQQIGSSNSSIAVLVVPAREDQMIAVHVERMARQEAQTLQR
jgi:acetate kinase